MPTTLQDKLTHEEQDILFKMIAYYISQEQKEIEELKLPSGNKEFLSSCEKRHATYMSIKEKLHLLLEK